VFAALDENGGEYFTRDPIMGSGGEGSWTVVLIEGVGAGNERLARFGLNSGLERMFDQSAGSLAVKTEPLSDFHFFFSNAGYERYRVLPEGSYTGIVVTRIGDEISGTAQDTRTHIVLDDLATAGEVITHFLMRLSPQ